MVTTVKGIGVLHVFVIHDRPDDHPSKAVVRAWRFGIDERTFDHDTLAVCDTVAQAREALPPGVTKLRSLRAVPDHETIEEVWMA